MTSAVRLTKKPIKLKLLTLAIIRKTLAFYFRTMTLELYFLLGTRSRRALLRTKHQRRRDFTYQPTSRLIKSLAEQTGDSEENIANRLRKEREFLLKLQGK
jgi:hypothetical protein